MQLNISGHHVELTPALRTYATKKLERIQKHSDRITSINITLNVEKRLQIAEATIHVDNRELHASSESEDLYSAIDLLVDKLDRQIKKHKEKLRDHRD